jgi:prepilin-type N-terminal cleavage/methylation domain-containing protein
MKSGFTLIEVVVVVVIISFATALLLVAFPSLRDHERLVAAEQALQSALRTAESQAINEERSEECRNLNLNQLECQRRCADVGVVADDDHLILFADLDQDGLWNQGGADCGGDLKLSEVPLPAGIKGSDELPAFVWRGVPPVVTLYVNGDEALKPQTVMFALGEKEITLYVNPYGHVSR